MTPEKNDTSVVRPPSATPSMNGQFRPAALALLISALLAGCVASSDYANEELRVPAQYGRGDAALNTPEQPLSLQATYPARDVAEDAWWLNFGDDNLDRMVQQALRVNSDLAIAGFRLQQARLQAELAGNDLLPQLNGSVSASSSRALDRHDTSVRSSGAGVSLGWEVDLWGRLRTQRDIASWDANASAEDRESTALSLVGEICRQYWSLAYLNQSIAAGAANLARLQRTVELVQSQFDAGAVSGLELREAQQNLEGQRTAQSQLLQQRVETRNAIAVLLDGNPWPQADEPQNLTFSRSPNLQPGIPAELLGRRPDLRAAELRLRGSLAAIKVTAASYYPALSLTGTVSTGATSLSDVIENPIGTLGAGLTLPFLNFREMHFNTEIAAADYQIAARDFRATLYTALSEVDNALSADAQLTEQVASAQRSFDSAADIERLYEVRYRAGATDLRVWLDAQQARRNAELTLAQVKLNQLTNDVTLYQALGGGD